LFSIGINTAKAITQALPNIPLSVTIGILGAAQAGIVAATPIPEFKEGGEHEGGFARFSERGHEMFFPKKGGAFLTPAKETIMNMPAGTFLDHKKTIQIMNNSLNVKGKQDGFTDIGKQIKGAMPKSYKLVYNNNVIGEVQMSNLRVQNRIDEYFS
jgi:hypothetical protein